MNPFEKLDANLARAIMSIGAIKAFEIGDGVKVSSANGSANNDSFRMNGDNTVTKATNHAGGILGASATVPKSYCARTLSLPRPSFRNRTL